jgi:hypothetical protein
MQAKVLAFHRTKVLRAKEVLGFQSDCSKKAVKSKARREPSHASAFHLKDFKKELGGDRGGRDPSWRPILLSK